MKHFLSTSDVGSSRVALIAGITGYIGRNLASYLLARGWKVCGIVRDKNSAIPSKNGNITLRVARSYKEIAEAFTDIKPDVVFHVAGKHVLDLASGEDVGVLVDANIRHGTLLLEAAVASATRSFVNMGTYWQNEVSDRPSPNSLYAATRLAFEEILKFYCDKKAVNAITLKLGDVYGPDDFRRKIFNLIHSAAVSGDVLDMSPGEQHLPFVFIDDVLSAFEVASNLVGSSTNKYASYCVWNEAIRLKDAVSTYTRITGRQVHINWGGLEYKAEQIMNPPAGIKLPGWDANTSLEEGLRKSFLD